jgi:hypothetical protein
MGKKLAEIIGGKNHVIEAKANPSLRGIKYDKCFVCVIFVKSLSNKINNLYF